MSRIKINLPQKFSFHITIDVRITDINYGGHVGNDSILSMIHEARQQFLKSLGYSELDFEGAGLIMNDVGIEYKSEAFYGDTLKIYVAASEIGKVGFDLCYKLVKSNDEKVVAVAKTGMVCFDYNLKKIRQLSQIAIHKFNAL